MKHYLDLSMSDLPGEKWLPVVGFEKFYQVSNLGRVKRIMSTTHHPHIMRQNLIRGYCNVCLCVDNVKRSFRVHRIMAFAFLKRIKGKPYINHKDGVRDNNELGNIEWCNNSENQKHSYANGRIHPRPLLGKTGKLCKNSKPVNQLSIDGKFIKRWPAQAEAARELGLFQTNISHTILGKHKSCGGFKWAYA